MSKIIVYELCAASNDDVPRLPWLLNEVPQQIMIGDMWLNSVSPLLDFATGPFDVIEEDGHFVLQSIDTESGRPVRLRITSTPWFPNALQYCNEYYLEWGESPLLRVLLLPAIHKDSTAGTA